MLKAAIEGSNPDQRDFFGLKFRPDGDSLLELNIVAGLISSADDGRQAAGIDFGTTILRSQCKNCFQTGW